MTMPAGNGAAKMPPEWTAIDTVDLPARSPSAWTRRAVAAASGLVLALAFPPVDVHPLAWIAFVPMLWVALGRGAGAAFRTAWITGLTFFLATLYWLILTIGTYTNLSPLVSVGPLLLLCGFLAVFFGLFAAACERFRQSRIDLALAAPLVWVALEWVRTYFMGGFPWVSLGYSQYRSTYLIQIAELTAVYGVSALIVLVNVVVYAAFRRWRDGEAPGSRALLSVAALLAILVVFGASRVRQLETTPPAGSLRVGFIQPNVAQDVKWDPAYQDASIARLEDLTARAVGEGAELIVWPETAAPFFLQMEGELRERILGIARQHGVWIVAGSPAFSHEGETLLLHNRVYLISPDGDAEQYYDKMELVPFGEYVPLSGLLFFVHKIVEGVGDFRAGGHTTVFSMARRGARAESAPRFGVLICYEGIFPGLTRRFVVGGADFLVNVTNDAWFGRTSAPYQHFAMTAVRAVENRVPIVRVANTGFSGMVGADGAIRWRTGLFETDWKVDTISWTGERTFYTRAGDVFVYGCLLVLALVAVIAVGRHGAGTEKGDVT